MAKDRSDRSYPNRGAGREREAGRRETTSRSDQDLDTRGSSRERSSSTPSMRGSEGREAETGRSGSPERGRTGPGPQSRTGMTRTAEGGRPGPEDRQQGWGPQGERATSLATRSGMPGSGLTSAFLSPFSFMRRFSEEMDRLFDDFGFGRSMGPAFGEFSPSGLSELGRAAWNPQVEVFRRGDELVVRADLPGLRKEDVRVDVQDDRLILEGERSWEDESEREGLVRSERHYGSFYRVIPLPEGARAEDARATYRDGVLEVTMPAPEMRQNRGRRLEIR